jgi:hypothetical protein
MSGSPIISKVTNRKYPLWKSHELRNVSQEKTFLKRLESAYQTKTQGFNWGQESPEFIDALF